jgi:hypothetical protein
LDALGRFADDDGGDHHHHHHPEFMKWQCIHVLTIMLFSLLL